MKRALITISILLAGYTSYSQIPGTQNKQKLTSPARQNQDTSITEQKRFVLAEGRYVGTGKLISNESRAVPKSDVQRALRDTAARRFPLEQGADIAVGTAYRTGRSGNESRPTAKEKQVKPERFILQVGENVSAGPAKP